MSTNIRVRFAPSPTGPLHIGGVRTALFNYLFAKKHNGTFVLRIEDTDQSRYVEGAEQYIVDALNWCGIPFDEGPTSTPLSTDSKNEQFGPYRQSERKHLYKQYADQLIAEGKAYYAFDTPEQLDAHRKDHEAQGKTFIYNWHNREKGRLVNSLVLSEEDTQAKITNGEDYAVRFKSPQDEIIKLKDIVRGEIKIDSNTLDDKVLFKSDGMPTYHLANIVDDHLMKISHVIRGEEWLPSLALHYLLYDAFGWETPEFAHLPLILKPSGKGKLSKRDGDKFGFPVFPLQWQDPKTSDISRGFKEDGYFDDALVNFLAFLGWNPGTEQELFSLDELIQAFELEKVNKAGARFDPEKIKWFNHQYMQTKSDLDLANAYINFLKSNTQLDQQTVETILKSDINYLALVIGLIKERAHFVSEFWELGHYFFVAPESYAEKALKKAVKPQTKDILEAVKQELSKVEDFNAEAIKTQIKSWITDQNLGFGAVMMPLRVALVGDLKGIDVFDIIFMIGKEETLKRIDGFITKIL